MRRFVVEWIFSPPMKEGEVKSHFELMRRVLNEMGTWCCTRTDRDWKYISARVEAEGDGFATIALPQFAKDLERALELGQTDSTHWVGYTRRGCLPAFLRGFTSQIFDECGTLLDEPSVRCIHAVRQVCNLLGKMYLPCSDEREKAAFRQYIETDEELLARWSTDAALLPESDLRDQFRAAVDSIWTPTFASIEQTLFDGDIVPKHGPGATADRLRSNAKFNQQLWTDRLEKIFPHGEFLFPNWRHFDASRVQLLEPGAEIPVRVISVPKTQKAPRIIAIEPTAVQYVQQGLLEIFLERIEGHRFLSQIVGFADQTPNQRMACRGSLQGDLATLDLSEASDRVAWPLVQDLFSKRPFLLECVDACRSRTADVPGHGIHTLFKYASMGSALCFPIEALVFSTIALMGVAQRRGVPLTNRFLKEMVGQVRVYGDDIIVPADSAESVVALLEAFGLRVNVHKSFWNGSFRESCGKEYFKGSDVSYVKVRRVLPTRRSHAQEIISTVSLRNQLFLAGFVETVEWLDTIIERLIPFPYVSDTSPGLGRYTWSTDYTVDYVCPHLQRPLARAAFVTAVPPKDPLDDTGALLKYFLKRGDLPLPKDHLKRGGRADSVRIIIGRVPVY